MIKLTVRLLPLLSEVANEYTALLRREYGGLAGSGVGDGGLVDAADVATVFGCLDWEGEVMPVDGGPGVANKAEREANLGREGEFR